MYRTLGDPDYFDGLFNRWVRVRDYSLLKGYWIFVANKDGSQVQYCRYIGQSASDNGSFMFFEKDSNGVLFAGEVPFNIEWWTPAPFPPNITNFEKDRTENNPFSLFMKNIRKK